MSLFGPTISVNNEFIRFTPLSGNPVLVYREDIEDLWNILRIRGTVQEADIPEAIRQDGASVWLLEFMGQLNYIRPIHLRSHKSKDFTTGIKYDPQPEIELLNQIDIIV
jgi:hypothetical protein